MMTLKEYFAIDCWQDREEIFHTWAEANGYQLEYEVHSELIQKMLKEMYEKEAYIGA